MSLTLDGSTRIIGTEFIKLEVTGTSNLATEAFVTNAVAGGNVDLTNYYDKTETDTLLNNKLNIDNPQDMSGTLRIGHVLGTSKIILNAVASDKDFYVNGDGEFGGNMSVLSLDSTGYVQCANVIASSDVKTNIIDSNGISDVTLKRNTFDICYLKSSSLELNAGINLVAPAQVQANTYNSFDDSSVLLLRNGNEFMRFRKTEDDILISKNINGNDLTVNNVFTTSLHGDACYSDSYRSRAYNVDLSFQGGNITEDGRISSMVFRHLLEDVRFLRNIYINNTFKIQSNIFDSSGNNDIVFKRNNVDIMTLNTTGLETGTGFKLITPTLSSNAGTNLAIQRGGVNYLSLAAGQVQLSSNITLTADTAVVPTINGIDCNANTFSVRHTTSDLVFEGANSLQNVKLTFMTFRRLTEDLMFYRNINIDTGYKMITDTISSPDATNLTIERGGVNFMTLQSDRISIASGIQIAGDLITGSSLHADMVNSDSFRGRTYTVDTPFLGANVAETGRITFMTYRHLLEDVGFLRNILIDDGKQISSNIYNSNGNLDVYLKRNSVDYIQLGGTSLRTRLLTGCQSDIYDSVGNSDATFRRNGVDFFYLKNGNVELNTNVDLSTDVVNSKGDNDIAFERNSVEYFKLTVINTEPFVMLGDTVNISAKECYANEFSNRSFNQDTLFYGSNVTDNGRVKYMEYKHNEEVLNIVSDATIETGSTLTGELVDTSSEKVKYDIEETNINFKPIVQGIKPKTFRMKAEKEIGITKNHIGFVAEDVEKHLPEDIENIIIDTHDVKN